MSCIKEKQPSLYKPRRPEKTDLHVTIRKNLSKWNREKESTDFTPIHVQKEFDSYLKCGILAHGFARAYCKTCDKEFFLAFSCKRRGVCPSCNQKRMIAVATHLVEEVIPRVRMRQYVISFPKRIRPYLKNKEIQKKVLKIVVGEIEKQIIDRSASVSNARAGGVSFFQRFGSSINFHPHFHICFTDGVFMEIAGQLQFVNANISPDDIQDIEDGIRKRVLKLFGRKGWIDKREAEDMLRWEHSGFSLNGSVCAEAWDREGLERLLRYCARPPFSSENVKVRKGKVVYTVMKPTPSGMRLIQFDPVEFIDRLSKLIPDPRCHLQYYHGAFAPNAPIRKKVSRQANKEVTEHVPFIEMFQKEEKQEKGSGSWAKLLTKIYEVFPLECTMCNETMKIVAFITNPYHAKQILERLKFSTKLFGPEPFVEKEWENESQLCAFTEDGFYPIYDPETVYEVCDLIPGTSDGFSEEYDAPHYDDSS